MLPRTLAGTFLGLILLAGGLGAAGPAGASHEAPTPVFETTIGEAPEPTLGYHVEEEDGTPGLAFERTMATFQIPQEFEYWYATVTEVHIVGVEVDVDKWILIDRPDSGTDMVVDNSASGFGFLLRHCPPVSLVCTYDVGDGNDHWNLHGNQVVEGTYGLELQGHTNAAYTVTVYGFDSKTVSNG